MAETQILFLDIETAPSLGYVWGKWEQDVIDFERDWYIMSFSAKWQDGPSMTVALPDFQNTYNKNKEDDSQLVSALHNLLGHADIVIAHNGDAFDIKKINARMLYHKLLPPSPYKTVDTLKVARKYFKFDSNKLDDLAKSLDIGRKLPHTGFKLWKDCMTGDMKAWELMKRYNKQDVILLEKVYETIKPWITNHPPVGVLSDRIGCCPNCGGNHLQARGFSISKAGKRQRFQCQTCGAWTIGKLFKYE